MSAARPGTLPMRPRNSRKAGRRNRPGRTGYSTDALWMNTTPMSVVSMPFASPAAIIAPELTPTYMSRLVRSMPSNDSEIACSVPTS